MLKMIDIKFTIITPTLIRNSLLRTCESIDEQTYTNYEHIIIVDLDALSKDDIKVIDNIRLKNRQIIYLNKCHNDFGNTPRNIAGRKATGDYIMYLDDDDYHINDTMTELNKKILELNELPDFAVFRCTRFNNEFTNFPPAICMTTSCQYIHKSIINGKVILWPTGDKGYLSDGLFIESLKKIADPVLLTTDAPLVCVDTMSTGIKN